MGRITEKETDFMRYTLFIDDVDTGLQSSGHPLNRMWLEGLGDITLDLLKERLLQNQKESKLRHEQWQKERDLEEAKMSSEL